MQYKTKTSVIIGHYAAVARMLAGLIGTFALLCLPCLCALPARAEGNRTDVELTTKDISQKESALGSLTADAIRASAKSDAAFIAASSFAEETISIKPGALTVAELLKTLEYKGDTIAIVKLTGEQIRAALEHGLYLYPKSNSGFLHTSGIVATINPTASGEKHILSIKINGSALDASKTYKVAMPAPLANGALAYFKIWKKSDLDKDTGKTLENALTAYLVDHKTIAKGDERLVAKK